MQWAQGTKGVIRNRKSRKDRKYNGHVLSVRPRFTTSDYPFCILWPLYCLSFLDFVLSVIPRFTTSDNPFGILWPLCGQTIEEGKTIQWPQDTKGIIRSRKSRTDRQYNGHKIQKG
jgi:hypothetical protein